MKRLYLLMAIDKLPIVCPCSEHVSLEECGSHLFCTKSNCVHSNEKPFQKLNGVPVLVSEQRTDTVCEAQNISSSVIQRRRWSQRIKNILGLRGSLSKTNAERLIDLCVSNDHRQRLLVIGGGDEGVGVQLLEDCGNFEIVVSDVYYSEITDIIFDAHHIPYANGSFDVIWIQAVLEHVVEPQIVVNEIYRVLKTDGIVYSEVPFLQQVHEGAFDFTRFTVQGHRALFKWFSEIDAGPLDGGVEVMSWSCRHFVWAVTKSRTLGVFVGLLVRFLLLPFKVIINERFKNDNSTGTYFLGRKNNKPYNHKELIARYRGVQK